MIGYLTLGTNAFEKASEFYDQLFATVGVERLWSHQTMIAWGISREAPAFCLTKPFDGKEATAGNGAMIALKMKSSEQVQSFHGKAIELGGTDDGKPGSRGDHGFFGAYFRDLDGNKLCAYISG